MTKYIVGIDIGETFTDLAYKNVLTGEVAGIKVPSTYPNCIDGLIDALNESKIKSKDIILIKHSCSFVANTVMKRKGVNTALITTKGFRDILEVARGDRPDHFNFLWDPGPPLVPRKNRFGVKERIDYKGNVIIELDTKQLLEVVEILKKREIEAIAISFINAYINPIHEKLAEKFIEDKFPDVYVTCSYKISNEIKEFERTSSTVVNAYTGPGFNGYYEELKVRLKEWGYKKDILFAHSSGGMMGLERARKVPGRTFLSGPASGVIGGAHTTKLAGEKNAITLNMGGTCTEIGVINDGEPLIKNTVDIEFNIPILFPCIDVVSTNIGSNSIAWIDTLGSLKCGPHTVDISSGPACYDLGGVEPTNTDANLVLGRLPPKGLAGGKIKLNPFFSQEVIDKKLAKQLNLTLEEAADGIIEITNNNIANAIRHVLIERGCESKKFTLVAFGGAAPAHVIDIAQKLNIQKVIIPPVSGVMTSLGLIRAGIKHDGIRSIMKGTEEISELELKNLCLELKEEISVSLKQEEVLEKDIDIQYFLNTKYQSKNQYLTLPLRMETICLKNIAEEHHRIHKEKFGYCFSQQLLSVEIANVQVVGIEKESDYKQLFTKMSKEKKALKVGTRKVYFNKLGFVPVKVYQRKELKPGFTFEGPAIIEEDHSTTVVPPNITVTLDNYLNIIMNLNAREQKLCDIKEKA